MLCKDDKLCTTLSKVAGYCSPDTGGCSLIEDRREHTSFILV